MLGGVSARVRTFTARVRQCEPISLPVCRLEAIRAHIGHLSRLQSLLSLVLPLGFRQIRLHRLKRHPALTTRPFSLLHGIQLFPTLVVVLKRACLRVVDGQDDRKLLSCLIQTISFIAARFLLIRDGLFKFFHFVDDIVYGGAGFPYWSILLRRAGSFSLVEKVGVK